MPIYRIVKENNYSIIDNEYLKDKSISFGAIGLMTILLSCKDDTKFSVELLSIISNKSKKVVTKYLNELKRNKYVNVLKKNSKDGFYYEYFIYESKTINPNFYNENPDTRNPSWESPPMEMVATNKYYNKQDKIIDKTKLDLTHITEWIVKRGLIELNDMTLFAYDDFLKEILNKYEYEKVIRSVTYTTNYIIKNKFLDMNNKPIQNLLVYFKSCVISNIDKQYTNEELTEYGLWN